MDVFSFCTICTIDNLLDNDYCKLYFYIQIIVFKVCFNFLAGTDCSFQNTIDFSYSKL